MLQSKAGYIDARPLTASSAKPLATHGRTIHLGQSRHFDPVPLTSDLPQQADIWAWVGSSQGSHFGLVRLSENKPVARSHGRGSGDLRPQAKRSRRGALFFLHFTLSRLQQTGDSWTAIRHRSRLCQSPSSTAWLTLRGASPEDRPRSSRSARRRRRRFGLYAHKKMVEAHSRGLDVRWTTDGL